MTGPRVLIIDDDEAFCGDLLLILGSQYSITVCHDGPQALKLLENDNPELVLLDVDFGRQQMSGLEILEHIRAQEDPPPVLMLSGSKEIDDVVQAIKLGAFHFVPKGADVAQLHNLMGQAMASRRSLMTIRAQQAEVDRLTGSFVAGDPKTHRMLKKLEQVATTSATVLITGESGTGKEMVARRIHQVSGLEGPFVGINCAAIPREMIESEIMGHCRGAFTGADKQRIGKLELASGGTLFLDEIGESPLDFQAKLLRALGEKVFTRLGENKELEVQTRIVAATSRDLAKAMEEGSFREDLFYRLNNFRLHLIPLNERPGDILPLARTFLEVEAGKLGKDIHGFSDAVEKRLPVHPWKGNVRQLKFDIERAAITCSGPVITLGDMFMEEGPSKTQDLLYDEAKKIVVSQWQHRFVCGKLEETQGNVSEAARLSGMQRSAFQRLMKKLGIDPAEFQG